MERIKLTAYETGVYYAKIYKAEMSYAKKDNACQLQFIMSMLVGKGNKDENGEYINYSCFQRKTYKESSDTIRAVAQQKEIVNVMSTMLGVSAERVAEELLPEVPFEKACDFYASAAEYFNKAVIDLSVKEKPFLCRMEHYGNGASFILGSTWIERCAWNNVQKQQHEDIMLNRTLYRLIDDNYQLIEAGLQGAVGNSITDNVEAPSTSKNGKTKVELTVNKDDPFGTEVEVTADDLPF